MTDTVTVEDASQELTAPAHAPEYYRGDAGGYPASFPKPRETIQVLDHDLTGYDRRLFNVLLHRSQNLLKQDPYQTFAAMATDLRAGVGQPGKNGNAPIKESLKRLQKTLVRLDYFNKGKLRERHLSLLITTDVPKNEGVVLWKFHPELAPLLANPQSYARVYLSVSAEMTGRYAPRLYDNIAYYATQNETTWRVSVDDLRELLNATASSYDEFRSFSAKVLRPAVDQINNADTPYHVRINYERDGDKRISHIVFEIHKRQSWRPQLEGPETVRVLSATDVRSLLGSDQQAGGDQPAGHEPTEEEIRRLYRRIKDATFRQLNDDYPALDVNATVREWAAWNIRTGRTVRRPKDELVRYFDAYYGHLKHKRPHEVSHGDTEISEDMRQALQAIGDMNVRQRQGWLAAAQAIDPDLNVPDLSCEHFMRWVPLILENLRAHRLVGDPRQAASMQEQLAFEA